MENIKGIQPRWSDCENNASGQKGVALLAVFSLLVKGNVYKTTLQVFPQTTVYVRKIMCQEGRRETNREARKTAAPRSATDPA